MATLKKEHLPIVKKLYTEKQHSMADIAKELGVPLGAVVYFMRKHGIERRSLSEISKQRFENKPASFTVRPIRTPQQKELKTTGVMLYWAEGYKSKKARNVDFANSDPEMISLFLLFMRNTYCLNESKFRVLVYCYADQDYAKIQKFWEKTTGIPKSQFTKPYIRKDVRKNTRKMPHGMIHVRYNDKKLLLHLKQLIAEYKEKYSCI